MAHDIDPVPEEFPDLEIPSDASRSAMVAVAPAIYLATAYRWGETNNHWYYVYAGTDRTKAMALAQVERDDRGGKYAVAVWEFTQDGCDYRLAGYFPSSAEQAETTEPSYSHHIDYYQRLGHFLHECATGKALLPDPEKSGQLTYQDVQIPEYQRIKVSSEQATLRAMNESDDALTKRGSHATV